jgi:hypothetical protein
LKIATTNTFSKLFSALIASSFAILQLATPTNVLHAEDAKQQDSFYELTSITSILNKDTHLNIQLQRTNNTDSASTTHIFQVQIGRNITMRNELLAYLHHEIEVQYPLFETQIASSEKQKTTNGTLDIQIKSDELEQIKDVSRNLTSKEQAFPIEINICNSEDGQCSNANAVQQIITFITYQESKTDTTNRKYSLAIVTNKEITAPYKNMDLSILAANNIDPALFGLPTNFADNANDTFDKNASNTLSEQTPVYYAAPNGADCTTMEYLNKHGVNTLFAGNMQAINALTYTPTAMIQPINANCDFGENPSLTSILTIDQTLDNTLNMRENLNIDVKNPIQTSTPLSLQFFLADTLVTANEAPGIERESIVYDQNNTNFAELLMNQLKNASWLRLNKLTDIGKTEPDIESSPVFGQIRNKTLTKKDISTLMLYASHLDNFAQITESPQTFLSENSKPIISVFDANTVNDSEASEKRLKDAINSTSSLLQSIEIADISSVTAISNEAQIPITLRNRLNEPINVTLDLEIFGQNKESGSKQEVKVPSNAEIVTKMPLSFKYFGLSTVKAHLANQAGDSIGDSITFSVTNVPEIGEYGLKLFIAGITLLFAFGIYRTIKKRKKHANSLKKGQNES